MKRFFALLASAALVFMMGACKKADNPSGPGNPGGAATTELSINVTDIADGGATLKAQITKGTATAYKVVYNYPVADLGFDPTSSTSLINFAKTNGVEVASLPHEKILTDLAHGTEYVSIVISYSGERVSASAYTIWTGVGASDEWAEDSDAGNLTPNPWN